MSELLTRNEILTIVNNVSKQRGIYFLIYLGEIVYIGQSENIFKRIAEHMKSKEFDGYAFEETNDNLNELEVDYILKLQPKLNSSLPSNSRFISFDNFAKKYKIKKWDLKRFVNDKNISPVWRDYYSLEELKGIL